MGGKFLGVMMNLINQSQKKMFKVPQRRIGNQGLIASAQGL